MHAPVSSFREVFRGFCAVLKHILRNLLYHKDNVTVWTLAEYKGLLFCKVLTKIYEVKHFYFSPNHTCQGKIIVTDCGLWLEYRGYIHTQTFFSRSHLNSTFLCWE